VAHATTGSASEVLREFVRLGLTGFGGPSAHLALFRQRFVHDLHWIDERAFVDSLGAANLLPGPTSTEMALAIGQARAGRLGLLAAGLGFISPAAVMVVVLAVAYERLGTLDAVGWLLYGIQPVVVAIVALAVAGLAPTALRDAVTWLIGVGATAALLVGADPVLVLATGAAAGVLGAWLRGWRPPAGVAGFLIGVAGVPARAATALGVAGIGLPGLFVLFLKIGLLSFGSGYVLVAFLRADLVQSLGLLTDRQLLDAVAVGQVTPGPVYTAATFVGYLLAGVPGAVVATIAIFLPAFVGVALVHPFVPRLRASPIASAVLDGVNAASLGLMAAVTIQLARATVVDAVTLALVVGAFAVAVRRPRAAVPLMLAGAAVGVVVHAAGVVG
jgi:chromate transporter